ncbi:uncharacterized protein LOC107270928 [Cephus cinctus]|uniref:Uncharacterized protein LOC107270928 n=1 Tax=Cephus cinctus TaxID=211228 RepID=A0AAJ7C5N8_CEPCN|nr:uncharacterized protein LOC107270928 [Cephus cinctus]
MWIAWLFLFYVTGISAALVEPQSISVNSPIRNEVGRGRESDRIRRYACPIGFFRINRQCYYLSGGKAPWREAYFHCKDRNATLAVLNRSKDRTLRNYLLGDRFTKLERWIGGIFNWRKGDWEWGVSGEKMEFMNFPKSNEKDNNHLAWHCAVMDPILKYKWNQRKCIEPKHYVCQVPAGGLRRRRKKNLNAPQNQRLKPRRKGKKRIPKRPPVVHGNWNRTQTDRRRDWDQENANQDWAHGVNLGYRPPPLTRMAPGARPSDRLRRRNETLLGRRHPPLSQIIPRGTEYGGFVGDSPIRSGNQAQGFVDVNNVLSQSDTRINDISLEEVLFKT